MVGRDERVTRMVWGVGIGLVGLAWFVTPLVRFADPIGLTRVGIAAMLIGLSLDLFRSNSGRRMDYLAAGILLGGLALAMYRVAPVLFEARDIIRQNDKRCLMMEREMMRAKPRRDDLPDMFQAFGCRPQTSIMPRRPVE